MGYKISTKKRIDLSQLGEDSAGNSFFVEIKNAKMMTYDEKMAFVKLAPKKDEEFTPEMAANLKDVASSLVLSWNLISIADESPVQIPSEDPEALNKVPSEVVEAIMKGLGENIGKSDEATKNSSVQLVKS